MVDAAGLLSLPGLIDLHTHVFHDFSYWGVDPDLIGPRQRRHHLGRRRLGRRPRRSAASAGTSCGAPRRASRPSSTSPRSDWSRPTSSSAAGATSTWTCWAARRREPRFRGGDQGPDGEPDRRGHRTGAAASRAAGGQRPRAAGHGAHRGCAAGDRRRAGPAAARRHRHSLLYRRLDEARRRRGYAAGFCPCGARPGGHPRPWARRGQPELRQRCGAAIGGDHAARHLHRPAPDEPARGFAGVERRGGVAGHPAAGGRRTTGSTCRCA